MHLIRPADCQRRVRVSPNRNRHSATTQRAALDRSPAKARLDVEEARAVRPGSFRPRLARRIEVWPSRRSCNVKPKDGSGTRMRVQVKGEKARHRFSDFEF